MYEIYLDRWLLPLTPQEIKISSENKNNTIMLINQGEFNILKKEGLKKISFEFILLYCQAHERRQTAYF